MGVAERAIDRIERTVGGVTLNLAANMLTVRIKVNLGHGTNAIACLTLAQGERLLSDLGKINAILRGRLAKS